MVTSTLAFDLLARDNGASAVFDKVSRAADKTGNALKKNSKISDEAAKKSDALTKARNAESDALDKVQVAEARLADVRGNSKAKTGQIVAAERALSKARRDAAVAGNVAQKAAKDLGTALDNEGKKAGKSAAKSVLHWFTGAGKDFEKAGKLGGEAFQGGITGILKTPVVGPAVAGALLAAVATAAPAAGAVVASGLVAGAGAGIAGIGLVFAAKSKVVQSVWSKTLSDMGKRTELLSKPFETSLIGMAVVAKRTFAAFAPELGSAFKTLAPAVTAFGDQLGRAFEKLAPAIQPLSQAFAAVLGSLGPALQGAVSNIAQGLIRLADSVKRSPDGLADLVKGFGDVARATIDIVTDLNNVNAAIKRLTGATGVTIVMKGLEGSIIGAGLALRAVALPITGADAVLRKLGITSKDTGSATGTFSSSLMAAVTAVQKAIPHAETLAQKFDRQWQATQRANDALTRMSGLLLTLSGSEIAYQAAVDDATASIKENGRTHDINTAKGRANKTALDQVAASAQAQTVAMRNAGDGNVAAAKAASGAQANFVKLAVQMGYTVPQAKAMAQSLIKIPNVTREAKLTANKKDLETKLAAAQKELANPNLTRERRAQLNAEISRLQAGIATAKAALASVPGSKTVTITTVYKTIGSRSSGSGSGGGHVNEDTHRASGGPVVKGMPYIVGEHRPELFVPSVSGTILPKVPSLARELMSKRSASTAMRPREVASGVPARSTTNVRNGGNTYVTINVNGAASPQMTADEIARSLRRYVKINGGNVQRAVGTSR